MKRIITTFTSVYLSGMLAAQVTIGTDEAPITGTLLQLKNQVGITNANANSHGGLGLPRVKLTSKTNLYPMFKENGANYSIGTENFNKTDEDAKHIGLIVYHSDQCSMQGKGLYVWDGAEWQRLPTEGVAGNIFVNKNHFDFPSGLDTRGSVTPQNLTVSWSLPGNLAYTLINPVGGGVPFKGANALPASPWATNPTTINLLPDAMTASDVTAATPWKSKETKLNFVDTQCDNTAKTVTINQTNYALKANNSTTNTNIAYTTAGNASFNVQSNARWTTSKSDPNNILSATTPTIGTSWGTDITNYPTITPTIPVTNFAYTTASGTKYQTASVTFSDATTPKRFNDVKVSIVNCSNTNEPSMEQWKDLLVAANGSALAQDIPASNGVAWHRDQDNNIFFSMNYDPAYPRGNTNRWMITNLAAKTYAPRTGTGGVLWAEAPLLPNSYGGPVSWAYPNAGSNPALSTTYDSRPRLGLYYTWHAATGNQNTSTTNQGGIDHEGVQGICPEGWHLPTDFEWKQLTSFLKSNASKYSGLADGSHSLFVMVDRCEPPIENNNSNSILDGGFSILNAGAADSGHCVFFGNGSQFWSSSFYTWSFLRQGYFVNVGSTSKEIEFGNNSPIYSLSVRCKQDPLKLTPSATQLFVANGSDYATPLSTQLSATVLGSTNQDVTWTSANPAIATVNASGLVTAVKNGRTTIIAVNQNGNKIATADIVVGCGAYVEKNVWKTFMCHNLGATTSLNPSIPVQGIHGNYYQWGRIAPVATAYSPTTANPMGTQWDDTSALAGAWNLGTETNPRKNETNDPCPPGFRVPTNTEWAGVLNATLNPTSSVGTWSVSTADHNKFDVGRKYGDYLFFPANGFLEWDTGALSYRGNHGLWWTSTENYYSFVNSSGGNTSTYNRAAGFAVRCIAID